MTVDSKVVKKMADMVKRFCNTFLTEGIFLLVIGALLMLLPMVTTFAMSVLISVALLVAGVYKFINTVIRRDEIEKPWLNILISMLMVVAGAYLVMQPVYNLFLITLGVGVYFLLEGVNSISTAFETRGIFKYWWVGLLVGLAQFALAFLIAFGLPGSALYTVGLLVSVSLMLSGIGVISVYTGAGCPRIAES